MSDEYPWVERGDTALSPSEMRERFLRNVHGIARYWARLPDKTALEVAEGVAFSILSAIDGSAIDLPSFDLVARPHPSDREYCQGRGERWVEDGTVINADAMLHEEWHDGGQRGE